MALSYSYNSATNSYSVVSNSCTAGAVVIPDTYNDGVNGVKPVKSIGASAFANCFDITSIFIPNSVTTIENGAFAYCPFLSVVTIGNSVTSIGNAAFIGCIALTSIVIPNSVTSIGNAAFMTTGLTSIIIPNGITSLGYLIFRNCQNLTSITIPESVTSIGEEAFSNCSSLTNITIPKNVISIGDYVFGNSINLETIIFLGDAPQFGSSPFESVNVNFKIYRIGGTKGWGIENAFQGKPISYYYKNLIKGGGTGKLVTKNKKASIQVIAKTSGLPPPGVPAYYLEGIYEYIGTYNEKNRYRRRSEDGNPRFYLSFANNRWGIGVDQIPEPPQFLQESSFIGDTLYPWIPAWNKTTIIQL